MTKTDYDSQADEISLIAVLQTIIENLRLLVIGPIVASLLALTVASLWPKTYESTAILKAEPFVVSMMFSADVLDPIASSLGYTPLIPIDDARIKLKEQIKASINTQDKLMTVTAQAKTPQAAQALAQAILLQTYAISQPRNSEKLRLQKQLLQAQTLEKEALQTAQILTRKLSESGGAGASEGGQGYAQLIRVVKESQNTQNDIERLLQGIDASSLVQEPTLPAKHTTPKLSLVASITALIVGFILLFVIFMRQTLQRAIQHEEFAQQIETMRASWRKTFGKVV